MSLPKGWKKVKLSEVAQELRDAYEPNANEDLTYIGLEHIEQQTLLLDDIGQSSETQSTKRKFEAGDVLFGSLRPYLRKVVKPPMSGVCSTEIIVLRSKEGFSQDFLLYFLMHDDFIAHVLRASHGSKMPRMKWSAVSQSEWSWPPLPEQIEIARILGVWDAAIGDTAQLIAAKTQHKRGLMQQLLTGERRFAEFEGQAWQTRKLGELFSERGEANRPDLPLLSITGTRGVVPRDEMERKDSSNKDKKAYLRIVPGDIGYNTMRMWQGVSAVSRLEGIISPAYTVCTPTKLIDAEFAGHLFKFGPMISLFHRHSQGMVADTLSLKYVNFARLKVEVPVVAEQRRIADVLDAATSEIQLLQKQLDALKTQKRGLMQLLLSGEKSVAVANAGNLDDVTRSNTEGER